MSDMDYLREEMRPAAVDKSALDQIASLLHGREWTPACLDVIAELVRDTGRTVGDVPEPDEPKPAIETVSEMQESAARMLDNLYTVRAYFEARGQLQLARKTCELSNDIERALRPDPLEDLPEAPAATTVTAEFLQSIEDSIRASAGRVQEGMARENATATEIEAARRMDGAGDVLVIDGKIWDGEIHGKLAPGGTVFMESNDELDFGQRLVVERSGEIRKPAHQSVKSWAESNKWDGGTISTDHPTFDEAEAWALSAAREIARPHRILVDGQIRYLPVETQAEFAGRFAGLAAANRTATVHERPRWKRVVVPVLIVFGSWAAIGFVAWLLWLLAHAAEGL